MKIFFQTNGWLKRYTNNKELTELEVEDGTTAEMAALMLGIPAEEIGIMIIDGQKIQENRILKDGDKIKLYTIILGG